MDFLNKNLYRAGPLIGILKKACIARSTAGEIAGVYREVGKQMGQ